MNPTGGPDPNDRQGRRQPIHPETLFVTLVRWCAGAKREESVTGSTAPAEMAVAAGGPEIIIAGVDTVGGLARMAGRRDAYLKLLKQFCDTQVRGPFHFWHHCHKVSAVARNDGTPGTLLRDEVEFELPLDPLSRLALPLVRSRMAAMFRFRQERTSELLALIARK